MGTTTEDNTTALPNGCAGFAQFILRNQAEITRYWVSAVDRSREIETEALTFQQLLDHFPQLCAELAESLKNPGDEEVREEARLHSIAHGRKRWQQGYRLEELIREISLVRRDFLGRWFDAFEEEYGELERESRRRAKRIVYRFFDDVIVDSTVQFVQEQQQRLVAAEEELRRQKERAENADATKERFIALISHELRTPLTPVVLSAAALSEEKSLSPDARELVALIAHNARAEATLIDDLLDASRMTRRALALKLEERDVHDCLRRALEDCARDFAAKKVEPEVRLGATRSRRMLDFSRLQRAFVALLRNAANVSRPRGEVLVSTRNIDHQIEVRIKDSGIEFGDQVAGRIFEPFEEGRKSPFGLGGVGLSRYVSKAIVEAHGGKLTAERARPKQGAVFTVTLPLSAA